ncbi:MAG: DUF4197 domain-containing protein [Chitinophagia bacterium]|nr:DUF4197 domain-containing protein [Chitinophagia bacterium]
MALAFLSICTQAPAQRLKNLIKDATKTVTGGGGGSSKGVTNTEITAALREALDLGAKSATGKLSVQNGYFGNALMKIYMPPEAKKVENTLRTIGMGSYVDKAILSMNRAAEEAAGKALPIFTTAVKNMSIQDALGILNGGNDAATQYLKTKTTTQLTDAFKPVITESLDKVNATKYWAEVFEAYNSLPTTYNKVNPDLSAYVTERALAGMFTAIAEEENKIRLDPAARVTDLLKKVFAKP